jgi:hypothetical protein
MVTWLDDAVGPCGCCSWCCCCCPTSDAVRVVRSVPPRERTHSSSVFSLYTSGHRARCSWIQCGARHVPLDRGCVAQRRHRSQHSDKADTRELRTAVSSTRRRAGPGGNATIPVTIDIVISTSSSAPMAATALAHGGMEVHSHRRTPFASGASTPSTDSVRHLRQQG